MKWFGLVVFGAAVTPTQKVVQLLTNMARNGKQQKHEEEVRFTRYKQWSEYTAEDRTQAIKQSDRRIEQLNANIQKAEADANKLGRAIEQIQTNIGMWEADQKAATAVRTKESGDYQQTHADYSESIDALERAIAILSSPDFDRSQANSLLQLNKMPLEARNALTAFLQKDPEDTDFLNREAPEANAYEFQSGGVVDMIKKLLGKFADERRALSREEAGKKHSYEMMSQDLTDQIENATSEVHDRTQQKGQREQDAADAQGELADRTAVRKQDQQYLDDLRAQTQQKTVDYENRNKLRGEELTTLHKAIEILSSAAVAGAAEKHLPALLQQRKTTPHARRHGVVALLQLRADTLHMSVTSPALAKRVAMFLSDRAAGSNSRLLAMLATKIESAGPLEKVKKMIFDMILRLQEEAAAETEHKGWCDVELAQNMVTRDQKNEELEQLTARCDSLTARIAKLAQDLSDLNEQMARIDAEVAEATENRNQEKAKNTETVTDAREAQEAVAQALVMLREFYTKAATTTSFVQGPADDAPNTFQESYQGQQSEGKGVIGLLEVIQSDFSRLESEVSSSEAQAARMYTKFTNDSEFDRTAKVEESGHRANEKQQKETALNAARRNLAGTQDELDAAMQYYEKLKPSCVDSGVSFEDRVARREEEIQSLKEALKIIGGEATM